jgi:arylsulfatase A-like enzyme
MFWSTPLGRTDYEIQQSLLQYSNRDTSFQLAHYVLGNAPAEEKCGELCRILRQYTNIRNAHTDTRLNLVDPLTPTTGPRPNIFIIVIDSMRPDYLGAYNPKVDFTPNIDSFSRDSIVFREAYSQYAGTTLSEPAIWSGGLLLHAHYLQPFSNVDSLEKLATVDGYQMYVTWDTVLRQLLSPRDNVIKLDANTLWNHYDFCQTSQEFFQVYDSRPANREPIFFYSQPMNVHQFANNSHPTAQQTGWFRKGFNARISLTVHQVDECMAGFLAELKKRGLYDNSVIVLTSDHGDATGELGRSMHAEIVYPEVMHVPLIVHLPKELRSQFHSDPNGLTALTDIAPSLFYLLGHRPIRSNPLFGRPFIAASAQELETSRHHELFLASDTRAAYGILDQDGRYFYATYDRPVQSYLYDLANDPLGTRDILTSPLKKRYDGRILDYLTMIARFYGYKPGLESLMAGKYQPPTETNSTEKADPSTH